MSDAPLDPTDFHFYEPARGHGLPHDPFNAMVGPRPNGWISSHDATGRLNLAPYSFFNAFNYTPPIVGFASIGYKRSVRNIAATREFTWNLVTRAQAEAMNATSAPVDADVDKFDLAGLPGAAAVDVTGPVGSIAAATTAAAAAGTRGSTARP